VRLYIYNYSKRTAVRL